MTYEVYSTKGTILATLHTQLEAERLMGAWFNAVAIVELDESGSRRVIAERKELHNG
jgi:hypothetical protein